MKSIYHAGNALTCTRRLMATLLLAAAMVGGPVVQGARAGGLPKAEPKATAAPTPTITVRLYTGEQDPNCSTGETYLRFFTPETGAVLSAVTPVAGGTDAALDIGGMFGDPDGVLTGLTQPTGQALLAKFKVGLDGITAKDNVALLLGDLLVSDTVTAVAQTGTPSGDLPTGVTIKSFLTLDGNGDDPFFLVELQGTGVTAANSLALCSYAPSGEVNSIVRADSGPEFSGTGLNVLVRNGEVIESGSGTKTIKKLTTLVGSHGTLADGRWRCDYSEINDGLAPQLQSDFPGLEENWIGVLLTFTDGTERIYAIPSTATGPSDWLLLVGTDITDETEGLDEAPFLSFGLPGFGEEDFAVVAKIGQPVILPTEVAADANPTESGSGTVNSSNNIVLIASFEEDLPYVVSRKGNTVPEDANGNALTGVTVSDFSDPVIGAEENVAFMVKMAGLPADANKGIMYSAFGETPYLLANIGAAAPGGGHWASFTSLVVQTDEEFFLARPAISNPNVNPNGEEFEGGGPIFVGTLKISGSDEVDASDNLGLWGVDGFGELILLLRSGQQVTVNETAKTIRTFVALSPAPGSVGAASGYDTLYGDVAVVATFTDGSEALLNIAIPDIDDFIP